MKHHIVNILLVKCLCCRYTLSLLESEDLKRNGHHALEPRVVPPSALVPSHGPQDLHRFFRRAHERDILSASLPDQTSLDGRLTLHLEPLVKPFGGDYDDRLAVPTDLRSSRDLRDLGPGAVAS